MDRRRRIQRGATRPTSITPRRSCSRWRRWLDTRVADARTEKPPTRAEAKRDADLHDPTKRAQVIVALERRMKAAAANLEFELAATLRDQLTELKAVDAPDVRRGGAPARPTRARARRRA
jgi:excinuclease UvrABC helicase subunit UvrB